MAYAEEFQVAKALYEGFTKELEQWLMAGAPVEETPDFKKYADGEQVDRALGSGDEYREHGVRSDREVPADPVLLRSASDDEVVIITCVDARERQVFDTTTGEVFGVGFRMATEITARKVEADWKLVSSRTVDWQACV